MIPKEMKPVILQYAETMCENAHPIFFYELVTVKPGSPMDFMPPCKECIAAIEREYVSQLEAHKRRLSKRQEQGRK